MISGGRTPADAAITAPTRRLVIGAAASVSGGCGILGRRGPRPAVQIVKVSGYDRALFDSVRRIFKDARLDLKGKRVVLKPNLVEFDARTAVNTHPKVVHAVLDAVRELGAKDVR